MRKVFILAIGTIGGIVIGWVFYVSSPPILEEGLHPNIVKTAGIPEKNISMVKISPPEVCTIKPTESIAPLKPLHSYENSEKIRDAKYLKVYQSPQKVVNEALNGDSDAAVALFLVIRSCYPRALKGSVPASDHNFTPTSSECPRLPNEYIEDPFKLLEAAANRGSTEAQFVYAINAVGLNKALRTINTNESVAFAAESLIRAEKYGKSAATSGLIDAYSFMSRSYLIGSFGYKDPELAYAYALPVAISDPILMQKPLDQLGLQLTEMQKSRAHEKVYGCRKNTHEK